LRNRLEMIPVGPRESAQPVIGPSCMKKGGAMTAEGMEQKAKDMLMKRFH